MGRPSMVPDGMVVPVAVPRTSASYNTPQSLTVADARDAYAGVAGQLIPQRVVPARGICGRASIPDQVMVTVRS